MPLMRPEKSGNGRNGSGDLPANDVYLRGQFPPPGKASMPWIGDTPTDVYHNRLNDFSSQIEQLKRSFALIARCSAMTVDPIVEMPGCRPTDVCCLARSSQ